MSLFHAHHFYTSFARAVSEAGAQQPRSLHAPLALRRSRRLARRCLSSAAMEMDADLPCSSPPPADASAMDVDLPFSSFSPSPSPIKRLRSFPPFHDAECATTTLWRASDYDSIVESEKEGVRAFFAANTVTVSFSFPGSCLSVVVANNFATMRQIRDIASRLCSLGVVGATTPMAPSFKTRKRSLERWLRDF